MVENETRKRLKCLIYDNGREYCSKEYDSYYSYHGICREKTFPGTPQENGVLERRYTMIMESARCMRFLVESTLQFWDDAMDIFVYSIKKLSSITLDGEILEEAWTGKKVNYHF